MTFDMAKYVSDAIGKPVVGVLLNSVSKTKTIVDARQKVMQTLEDNAVHAETGIWRKWTVCGEEKQAPLCYKEDKGGKYQVWVMFNRSRMQIGNANSVPVDKADVPATLRALAKAVGAGHFDEPIEARRTVPAAMKTAGKKTAKKK